MGPLYIEGNHSTTTETPKPNLWFGRREWRWAVRMSLVVTLLTLFGWSFYSGDEQVYYPLDAYSAGEPHPGQPGYEGDCSLDDYNCGQQYPPLPWYREILIEAPKPTGLYFTDSFVVLSSLSAPKLTWVEEPQDGTYLASVWVPEAYLTHNTIQGRLRDLSICGQALELGCVPLSLDQNKYIMVAED